MRAAFASRVDFPAGGMLDAGVADLRTTCGRLTNAAKASELTAARPGDRAPFGVTLLTSWTKCEPARCTGPPPARFRFLPRGSELT